MEGEGGEKLLKRMLEGEKGRLVDVLVSVERKTGREQDIGLRALRRVEGEARARSESYETR